MLCALQRDHRLNCQSHSGKQRMEEISHSLFEGKKPKYIRNIDQKCFQVSDTSKWQNCYIFWDSGSFTFKILIDLMRESYEILATAAAASYYVLLLLLLNNIEHKKKKIEQLKKERMMSIALYHYITTVLFYSGVPWALSNAAQIHCQWQMGTFCSCFSTIFDICHDDKVSLFSQISHTMDVFLRKELDWTFNNIPTTLTCSGHNVSNCTVFWTTFCSET